MEKPNFTLLITPFGRLNRRLFLLTTALTILCFILVFRTVNSWALQKILMKTSLEFQIPWLNFLPDVVSTFSLILMGYLLVIATVNRFQDMTGFKWWFFLIPGIFAITSAINQGYLSIFWVYVLSFVGIPCVLALMTGLMLLFVAPGYHTHNVNIRPPTWTGTILLFLTVTTLLFEIVAISPFISLYLPVARPQNNPLRIWNQSKRTLNLQVTTSEGVVRQLYQTGVPPDEIFIYETILFHHSDFNFKATDSTQNIVFNKSFTQTEIGLARWIIVIPPDQ
jgi:hypothetical protein